MFKLYDKVYLQNNKKDKWIIVDIPKDDSLMIRISRNSVSTFVKMSDLSLAV